MVSHPYAIVKVIVPLKYMGRKDEIREIIEKKKVEIDRELLALIKMRLN